MPREKTRCDSTRALGSCRPPHLFRSAGDTIYIAVGNLTFVVGACANWFYRHRRPRRHACQDLVTAEALWFRTRGFDPITGGGNVRRVPIATTNFVDRSEEAICQSEVKANAVKVRPSQSAVGSPDRRRGLMSGGKSPESAPTIGKWLGLLREIAPGVTRVALMFNPDTTRWKKSDS